MSGFYIIMFYFWTILNINLFSQTNIRGQISAKHQNHSDFSPSDIMVSGRIGRSSLFETDSKIEVALEVN